MFVRDGSGTWSQQAYLKASNAEGGDRFGKAVAVSGDTVVVGAYFENSNAIGGQANNDALNAGAAYVFVRDGAGTWSQQAYLKASNTEAFDNFGESIAVSVDTVVVGAVREASNATGGQANNDASGAGAAYVFVRDGGGTWSQQAYLKASTAEEFDNFGVAVAISGDTVVVGADGEDSASTEVDVGQTNNDASSAGAAYVFVRTGSTWSQQAYLKASNAESFDRFGGSVAVSGDTVVVGAKTEDSNATGVNGNGDNNDASNAGAAYVFVRTGSTWLQQAYLKASNPEDFDNFGGSIAVSGDIVVVGAKSEDSNATGVNGNQGDNTAGGAGAAYIFDLNEAPTVSGTLTDNVQDEDTSDNLDFSALTFTDADGNSLTVTLTVSAGTFATPSDGAGVGAGVTETLVSATVITLEGSASRHHQLPGFGQHSLDAPAQCLWR